MPPRSPLALRDDGRPVGVHLEAEARQGGAEGLELRLAAEEGHDGAGAGEQPRRAAEHGDLEAVREHDEQVWRGQGEGAEELGAVARRLYADLRPGRLLVVADGEGPAVAQGGARDGGVREAIAAEALLAEGRGGAVGLEDVPPRPPPRRTRQGRNKRTTAEYLDIVPGLLGTEPCTRAYGHSHVPAQARKVPTGPHHTAPDQTPVTHLSGF